jgi:TetR/AcrR family transcriptional regulator of autoinduction and epiphytic fitness
MSKKEEIIPRIQEAALEEFIQRGVEASSMERILKAAKTTKRTLYKYYPNKKAIFDEIIALLLERLDAYSNFNYSTDISIEEQIDEIIKMKMELMLNDDYIKISKLLSIELIKSNPIDKVHFEKFYESEKSFIEWIKDAQKYKNISDHQSPELIANQFHSLMKGQIFYPVLYGMAKITEKEIKDCRITVKSFFINSFCKSST